MTDAAIANAKAHQDALAKRINMLVQELDGLRREMDDVKTFIRQWHRFAGTGEDTAGIQGEQEENKESAQPVDNEEKPRRSRSANPKKELVAEVARRIIAETGEPMARSALFQALKERGIELEGSEPEMVLSTMLWRTQKQGGPITRLKSGGYWLADTPHEASGYDPAERDADAPDDARARHAELSKEIGEADRLYHSEDAPEITDKEYDGLRQEREEIEARHPDLAAERAAETAVGAEAGEENSQLFRQPRPPEWSM